MLSVVSQRKRWPNRQKAVEKLIKISVNIFCLLDYVDVLVIRTNGSIAHGHALLVQSALGESFHCLVAETRNACFISLQIIYSYSIDEQTGPEDGLQLSAPVWPSSLSPVALQLSLLKHDLSEVAKVRQIINSTGGPAH